MAPSEREREREREEREREKEREGEREKGAERQLANTKGRRRRTAFVLGLFSTSSALGAPTRICGALHSEKISSIHLGVSITF